MTFDNILLQNVLVQDPWLSPGEERKKKKKEKEKEKERKEKGENKIKIMPAFVIMLEIYPFVHLSKGVILGNATNPMRNIVFDNVTVVNPGEFPYHHQYQCEFANVTSLHGTSPAPACA